MSWTQGTVQSAAVRDTGPLNSHPLQSGLHQRRKKQQAQTQRGVANKTPGDRWTQVNSESQTRDTRTVDDPI